MFVIIIMTFYDHIQKYKWDNITDEIYSKTTEDVRMALDKPKRDLEDFKALLSPSAEKFIEEMAQESKQLTLERFGNVVQLYIPLYLSNYCHNACIYCGFSSRNKIERKILSIEEIEQEIKVIKRLGYKHILLVSGEAPNKSNADYYRKVINFIKKDFSQIALEVQPLDTYEYAMLKDEKLDYVCIYQETYNEKNYATYHIAGKKRDFRYRLETPDRIGEAGIHKIGIGALLGLEDWRTDAFFTAVHLKYLEKKYWKTRYSISLPRLRPVVGGYKPNSPVSDKNLVQLICAYRLLDKDVEISLSTRESSEFRDNVFPLGITSMSAGSSTEPGGYANTSARLEQFEINDCRTPEEFVVSLKSRGYEAVWKDWDVWM